MTTPLQKAAKALINRWDLPAWRDQPHTAHCIAELRKALDAELAQSVEPVAWIKLNDDGRTGALFHQNEGWKDASELVPLYLHPPQQVAVPQKCKQIHVTEAMHRAAVKVLHRAPGVAGLPQRMMDAMLAAQGEKL